MAPSDAEVCSVAAVLMAARRGQVSNATSGYWLTPALDNKRRLNGMKQGIGICYRAGYFSRLQQYARRVYMIPDI